MASRIIETDMNRPIQNDDLSANRRRRLLFRCWHRGTQESDLLLGKFADSCLEVLDASQLNQFDALLDCSDPELFEWILEGGVPPAEHNHNVLRLLRAYWSQRYHNGLKHFQTDISPRGE
jgi:antitoxin CptB